MIDSLSSPPYEWTAALQISRYGDAQTRLTGRILHGLTANITPETFLAQCRERAEQSRDYYNI